MANEETTPTPGNDDGIHRSKWMVNIFNEPKHRTRYLKMLEPISSAPYVTFERMVISLAILLVVVIIVVVSLLQPAIKLKYTAIWSVTGGLAAVALVALYALPARDKSLAGTALDIVNGNALSKALGLKSKIGTVGVDAIIPDPDGSGRAVIKFTGGDVGVAYRLSGAVGISTLPAIAERVRVAKYQYLVSRNDTTREVLLTRVQTASFTTQLTSLKQSADATLAGPSPDSEANQWRRYMARVIYDYIYDNIRDNDTLIEQFLVVRDEDMQSLNAAVQKLNDSVAAGMYARLTPLSPEQFEDLLLNVTTSEPKRAATDGLKPSTER